MYIKKEYDDLQILFDLDSIGYNAKARSLMLWLINFIVCGKYTLT